MPPAAKLGSNTSHGTPVLVGPGSPNVLIGNMPALRLSDSHACPVTTPNPHVGGTIISGSGTVMINNLPAARVGDKIVESAGPPNLIISGETTVIIG